VGGLGAFLSQNSDVTVIVPESFPVSFQKEVQQLGAKIETVSGPRQLMNDVYSTGEMGLAIKEQSLILDSPKGLILITGCAHPNVAEIAEQAITYRGKIIYLLTGGFHLGGRSDSEVMMIIRRLKKMGVKKVAPSHCTGDNAIRLFREQWGDDFINGGLGAVIKVPQ
jgi:7,8-dihydropterin-6-yl-methyl-4-(beta-D-ribofuranosyl)aminobenzene 5'-phosphate synthase